MKLSSILATLVFTTQFIFAAGEIPMTGGFEFNEKQEKNRYYNDFVKWAEQDKETPIDKDTVLCIGSSSIKGWNWIKSDLAPFKIIKRGFGGSTMADVLVWENFFLRYKSGKVLIYEGDNDMVNPKTTPQTFLSRYKKFCNALLKSQPDIRIYIISIKPSIARMNLWPKMLEANELLKKYADGNPAVSYIDVASPMLNEDGSPKAELLSNDKLHMSRDGYKLWGEIIRLALEQQ